MDSVNQISSYVDEGLNLVNQNKVLSSVLGMLLVLYAAAAAPKLSPSVVKIFDNNLFKLVYIFLIGYLATKDPSVAIITAVTLLVSIQTLSAHEASVQAVINANARSANKVSSDLHRSVVEIAAPVAPIINPIKRVFINIKDSFGETKKVSIPLSPSRAEFIEECTKRANEYYKIAKDAHTTGNVELANSAVNEGAKQEVKAEAILIAKHHIIAASDASASGDHELAQIHINEAVMHEEKAKALVKAEVHSIAANEANQRGAVDEANAHLQASLHEEAKALELTKQTQPQTQPQTQNVPLQQDFFLPAPDSSNADEHALIADMPVLASCNNNSTMVKSCANNIEFGIDGYVENDSLYGSY